MQSTVRFIRKNLLIFSFSLIILLIINLIAYVYWGYKTMRFYDSIIDPDTLYSQLTNQINQSYSPIIIDKKSLSTLEENNIWAMIIDDITGEVIWSYALPEEIPTNYSMRDIALFTRYYLKDYPVFTYVNNKGLLVLGYPKDSYAKIPVNAFPLSFLRNLPRNIMYFLLLNIIIVFIIYMISKKKLIQSINPITEAIYRISNGEKVQLKEKGDLLDIKMAVNKTSKRLLERDSMRANWIAGISHDIRTPLSLIIGYTDRLLESHSLNEKEKKEIELIQRNSTQIQNLISNLNLTYRLEYNLMPIEKKSVSITKVLREIIVDFMNHENENIYDFNFVSTGVSSSTVIYGNEKLLERAFRNIILNSIKHNPTGCKIQIEIDSNNTEVSITISDDGIGVAAEKLKSLNSSIEEHIKENNKTEKSHGLGLLIVKQILQLHQGTVTFNSVENEGFTTTITLPLCKNLNPNKYS